MDSDCEAVGGQWWPAQLEKVLGRRVAWAEWPGHRGSPGPALSPNSRLMSDIAFNRAALTHSKHGSAGRHPTGPAPCTAQSSGGGQGPLPTVSSPEGLGREPWLCGVCHASEVEVQESLLQRLRLPTPSGVLRPGALGPVWGGLALCVLWRFTNSRFTQYVKSAEKHISEEASLPWLVRTSETCSHRWPLMGLLGE